MFGGRLYLILDELAALPTLRRLDQALEFGRGFQVRVVAGLQNVDQLRENYRENPHLANVILGSFQSIVAFHSDSNTAQFVKEKLGNARVSPVYTVLGGGVAYGPPETVPVLEPRLLLRLGMGDAVVALWGNEPFKFHFPLYEQRKRHSGTG